MLRSAVDLLSARMTLGALRVFVLSAALIAATGRDLRQNSTLKLESDTWSSQGGDHTDAPWTISLERFPHQELVSAIRSLRPGEGRKTSVPPDKKTKSKFTPDNTTGLRKSNAVPSNRLLTNALPGHTTGTEHSTQHALLHNQNLHQSAAMPSSLHAGRSMSHNGFNELLDHESNRPMRFSLHKATGPSHNASRAAWMTNRQPSSLLYQFEAFRKEPDSKERDCLHECHKQRDEKEAYCNSDFAVNGIIHDMDTVGKGMQLLTVLVDSAGLYKMNRLYITPDGFFFRVKVLAVENSHCSRSCPDFKFGGRYILMGRIYHKRMELPALIQRAISGRLRAGDGLVTSSGSFVRRYNRKKERRVLAAAHSKCK